MHSWQRYSSFSQVAAARMSARVLPPARTVGALCFCGYIRAREERVQCPGQGRGRVQAGAGVRRMQRRQKCARTHTAMCTANGVTTKLGPAMKSTGAYTNAWHLTLVEKMFTY